VLVAVSGGADSTALLLALYNLRHEFGVELTAAHLDHGLRGSESADDRAFVRALCARLGVPLGDARWNTRARMTRRGLSGQAGLRVLRREFLLAIAQRYDATAIATAHTADDQVETVLLRLARGAGIRGLSAMPPRRGRWIRPLLDAPRADIETDLRRIGQRWREDSTNAGLDYARNRVRHLVVPALLEALDPGSSKRSGAHAALARRVVTGLGEVQSAHRLLRRRVLRTVRGLGRIQGGEIRLDSVEWRSYPAVIQRLALREAWARLAGGRTGLTSRHLDQLADLLRPGRMGARAELPLGARAVREPRGLTLRLAPNSVRTSTSAARSIAR
jgi:tRNA(Ile)-lysidine synthase